MLTYSSNLRDMIVDEETLLHMRLQRNKQQPCYFKRNTSRWLCCLIVSVETLGRATVSVEMKSSGISDPGHHGVSDNTGGWQ